jgi:hypothetical protein
LKALPVAAILVGASVGFPTVSSAATVQNAYDITVSPTAQFPGQSVTVTGIGQTPPPGGTSDNCDSTTITVTVTYFTLSGTQKTAQTDLPNQSDGNGNVSGPVTIPADAAPSSVSGHDADVQASCNIGDNTNESNIVTVTVEGTVTTTTTAPTTTTTTTVPVTSTTVPVTTTTVPLPAAPAASAVSGTPKLTG